jgi:hypothetical protein
MSGVSVHQSNVQGVARIHRCRPSVLAAWKWERRKAGNTWYWLTLIVFAFFSLLQGWNDYVAYQTDWERQHTTWAAVWVQGLMMSALFFIPLLVAAFAAQVESNEHRGRNWQRLNATGSSNVAVAGKMLHGLEASILTVLVIEAVFVIIGGLMGHFSMNVFSLDQSSIGPFLLRSIPMTLAVWAVFTLTQAIASRTESFAVTMSVMLLLVIVGSGLFVKVHFLSVAFPTALIVNAASTMDVAQINSVASMAQTSLISAFWLVLSALFFRHMVKKAI